MSDRSQRSGNVEKAERPQSRASSGKLHRILLCGKFHMLRSRSGALSRRLDAARRSASRSDHQLPAVRASKRLSTSKARILFRIPSRARRCGRCSALGLVSRTATFTGELARAIHDSGLGIVILVVRSVRRAVKYIVGRNMNQRNSELGGLCGEVLGAQAFAGVSVVICDSAPSTSLKAAAFITRSGCSRFSTLWIWLSRVISSSQRAEGDDLVSAK